MHAAAAAAGRWHKLLDSTFIPIVSDVVHDRFLTLQKQANQERYHHRRHTNPGTTDGADAEAGEAEPLEAVVPKRLGTAARRTVPHPNSPVSRSNTSEIRRMPLLSGMGVMFADTSVSIKGPGPSVSPALAEDSAADHVVAAERPQSNQRPATRCTAGHGVSRGREIRRCVPLLFSGQECVRCGVDLEAASGNVVQLRREAPLEGALQLRHARAFAATRTTVASPAPIRTQTAPARASARGTGGGGALLAFLPSSSRSTAEAKDSAVAGRWGGSDAGPIVGRQRRCQGGGGTVFGYKAATAPSNSGSTFKAAAAAHQQHRAIVAIRCLCPPPVA